MEKDNNKKQRTIQVKIGNHVAQQMTPDQAASYLKSIKSSLGGSSLPNQISSTSLSQNNLTTLELAALAGDRRKVNTTPTEKEMKSLMSMFAEIMGLQMNTDKLPKVNESTAVREDGKSTFEFPANLPPPPGGWPKALMLQPSDTDESCLPPLEQSPPPAPSGKPMATKAALVAPKSSKLCNHQGIAPWEWDALDRVAMEDALEGEERARRKPYHDKTKQLQTPLPAVDDGQEERKEEQARVFQAWKQRMLSACQTNDLIAVKLCIADQPIVPDSTELYQLVLLTVSKKQKSNIREALVECMAKIDINVMFAPLRNGRSAMAWACFLPEVTVVRIVLQELKSSTHLLESKCVDSGWTPLHYACLSGSLQVVEMLLNAGACLDNCTAETHTWRKTDGGGVMARELVDAVMMGKQEDIFESHGMALYEAQPRTKSQYRAALQTIKSRLEHVERNGFAPLSAKEVTRLENEGRKTAVDAVSRAPGSIASDDTLKKGKRSKKTSLCDKSDVKLVADAKESCTRSANKSETSQSGTEASYLGGRHGQVLAAEDPLVVALKDVGFPEVQVIAGIRACGGHNRAAADDVVVWILGQNEGGAAGADSSCKVDVVSATDESKLDAGDFRDKNNVKVTTANQRASIETQDNSQLDAQRQAAKREEQRRRNREWNSRQARQNLVDTNVKLTPTADMKSRTAAMMARGGLAPASNFIRLGSTSFGSNEGAKVLAGAGANQPRPNKLTVDESVLSANDVSTTASSFERFEHAMESIEIGNDDITVSTLGSMPTRATPVPTTSSGSATQLSAAPPGFGTSVAVVPEEPVVPPFGWECKQPPITEQREIRMPPRYGMAIPPPPGIPESSPYVDGMGFQGSSLPSSYFGNSQSRFLSGQDGFGSGAYYTPAPSSLIDDSFRSTESRLLGSTGGYVPIATNLGLVSSGIFDSSHRNGDFQGMMKHAENQSSPVPPSVESSLSGPAGHSHLGLTFDQPMRTSIPAASSLVESISTGHTAIDAANLWGSQGGGSSSRLGSFMNDYHNSEQSTSLFATDMTHNVSHGFERPPANPFQTSAGSASLHSTGAAGGSIW